MQRNLAIPPHLTNWGLLLFYCTLPGVQKIRDMILVEQELFSAHCTYIDNISHKIYTMFCSVFFSFVMVIWSHSGLVMSYSAMDLSQLQFRKCFFTDSVPRNYLNQFWLSVKCAPIHLIFIWNSNVFIHANLFGSGHETVAVLLPGFAINW